MKTNQFDKFAKNYNEILFDSIRFFGCDTAYYTSYKVNIVRAYAKPSANMILDFGCGRGNSIPYLRDSFPSATVSGCDISDTSLNEARTINPGVDFFNSTETISLKKKFDIIFVANVLHHIPEDNRSLWIINLRKLLNPGGEVFIFEHNPLNPVVRHVVRSCPLDEDAVLVWPNETRRLLANSGFTISKWGYTLFFCASLNRMRFLEPLIRWLPLGAQFFFQAKY